jgi:hypothetical protein
MIEMSKYVPRLKDRAAQLEKVLADARSVGVPESKLKGLKTFEQVVLAKSAWLKSKESMALKDAERRTEEHNNLLAFIQWYLSWEEADPQEIGPLKSVQSLVERGANLKKINWLVRMRDDLVRQGKYTPKTNLMRNNAPWR